MEVVAQLYHLGCLLLAKFARSCSTEATLWDAEADVKNWSDDENAEDDVVCTLTALGGGRQVSQCQPVPLRATCSLCA